MSQDEKFILVTGATGYLALNVIKELAKLPHRIRVTVRNLNDLKKINIIKRAAKGAMHPIQIVNADLLQPESWSIACKDIDIVIHVASPFPSQTPDDPENIVLKPAIQGTKNVLDAAFKSKVKRVVLTSSCASVYNFTAKNKIYTEKDWNDPNVCPPYAKSKILAERAAWEFVEEKKNKKEKCFELAVINPCFILGPSLGDSNSLGTSESYIINLLKGEPEKTTERYIGHCDVRDVALAHVRAAFIPEAAGHRHIIETKWTSNKEVFEILKKNSSFQKFRLITQFEPGENPNNKSDTTRMRKILGIEPTDFEKTIIDMAESLIKSGCFKKK